MNMHTRTPVEADISHFGGETKVRFFMNGKKYAFICDTQELNTLETKEGTEIRKISL